MILYFVAVIFTINILLVLSIILIFLNLKEYDQCLTIVCYIGLKAMYVMH